MSVTFKNNIFYLNTPNTSYMIGIYEGKLPVHLYYGKKISGEISMERALPVKAARGLIPNLPELQEASNAVLPAEYASFGSCDFREPAICLCYPDGSRISKFEYAGYSITKGKPKLKGLPSAYVEDEEEADTLEITLLDKLKAMELTLVYTVYRHCDIITKSVRLKNHSEDKCCIERILSSSFDMANDNYDLITLNGDWCRERHISRTPVFHGYSGVDSKRGASSHQHNPFFCLAGKNTDEKAGDAYGFSLVYSGNFKAGVEVCEVNTIRAMIGINDFGFRWVLTPGEEFYAPEVLLTFSSEGIGEMSRNLNRFIRTRICRGRYRDERRPVLLNNWEATYFDFDEEKIISIAKKAKEAGVELLVLDDGWFGKRNDDTSSLGDWEVNKEKLPNGIDGLAKKVNEEGLKFGLWFEPEMVSPDSDLYRKHPDWCIHTNGRERSLSRNQLILDLSREDVCSFIIDTLSNHLNSANIEYIKWDMNRYMSEAGSALLEPERSGEFYHRYMLGLYHILDTLMSSFPNVLFEGCASGGGRFDPGMLCYFPQIWTSDDSDAIERLSIQYGTSLVYPVSSMGAHVSIVPNHQVHRVCPIKTRGDIAMMGAFGYELDLNALSEEEFEIVKKQIEFSKKYSSIIHKSDLYRLKSPFDSNFAAFEFVSEDRRDVFMLFANILGEPNTILHQVKLQGLEDDAFYKDEETGEVYTGSFLKNIGLFFDNGNGDFRTVFVKLTRQ